MTEEGRAQGKLTFQRNVLETNDLANYARTATIVGIAVTFLTSMAVGRGGDPAIIYLMFMVGTIVAASQHPKFKRGELSGYPGWKLENVWRPIGQSLAVGLVVMLTLVFGFGWALGGLPVGEAIALIVVVGVAGAFVEEYVRWVWLQTLPVSIITANLLWVMLHPSVARMFRGEMPDLAFALVAINFGFLMTAVMWLYESPVPGAQGYGPVAAATLHGVYNSFAVLFVMDVAGLTLGPMTALVVVLVGVTLLLLSVSRHRRRHQQRREVPNAVNAC